MIPPKFVESPEDFEGIFEKVKLWVCPFCQRLGTLNRHGFLTRFDESLRGIRLWCSSRRKSHCGCGKSLSITLSTYIPHYTVKTQQLWSFLLEWLLRDNTHQAHLASQTSFSLESAYRWILRLQEHQPSLRERLIRLRAPPQSQHTCPLKGLLEHLSNALKNGDKLGHYQIVFQEAFLRKADVF